MTGILILILIIVCLVLAFKRPGIALVLSLPISAGSFIWALVISETNAEPSVLETAAILIGIFTAGITICVIRFKPAEPEEKDKWPYIFVRVLFKVLLYSLLLGVAFTFFNGLGVVAWGFYMIFIHRYYLSHRNAAELDVVSTLGACIRQNMPLPAALKIAGQSDKAGSRVFRKMHKWLVQGYSVSEAIKRGFPRCSPYITSTITAAEDLGQLPQGIKNLEKEMIEKGDDYKKIHSIHPGYPALVISFALLVMLGLIIFIIPTFAEVLKDMGDGAGLPKSTQILINTADFLLRESTLVALVPVVILAFFYYFLMPYIKFFGLFKRNSNKERDGRLSIVKDYIKWYLPVFHWFENSYSLARVIGLLKVGLKSGHPVDVAISKACELDVNHCFKERLKSWLFRVERGDNISKAALDCGVGKSLAWAFDDKVNAGNTPDILEMLEELYRVNLSYRFNIVKAVSMPLIIVLLGCVVGFLCFGMFMPIVKIIEVLSAGVTP